jgi:hypothetical protein
MKEPPPKNMSASVRDRLLNLARSSNRDFQELVIRYTVERFLARLTSSVHQDRFILKGAMLYTAWKLDDKRTTMDLDLLGTGNPDPKDLSRTFREICVVSIDDDGLMFDKESITAVPIREEAIYDGVRVVMRVHLGVVSIRLQVDVGFGDAIVPAPQPAEFPSLLAENGPVVKAYSPETVVAEKFNAMVLLGMANSRMKDYFDIWMLSRSFAFEGPVLREAIANTFRKRQTSLPESMPVGLTEEFSGSNTKQAQWGGFIRRQKRLGTAPSLPDVVKGIHSFLRPVATQIPYYTNTTLLWSPTSGWHEDPDTTQTPDR